MNAVAPALTTSEDTAAATPIENGASVIIYKIHVDPQLITRTYTFSDNAGNTVLTIVGSSHVTMSIPFLASNGFNIDAVPEGNVAVWHSRGGA
jgi:hypothetical protein